MKSSKVDTKKENNPNQRFAKKARRTQTAEGWRRSVEKICEKRREKTEE